jgi:predicted nucleic acid-binding protein
MSLRVYLDASVLVSLYVPEITTMAVESLVAGEASVAVSALTMLETQVALERKRKAGKLPDLAVQAVRARLTAELDCRRLCYYPVDDADYRRADELSQCVPGPIRSLDVIHAALAQRLGLALVTLDQRLHVAAQAAGLASRWRDVSVL